MSSSEEPYHSRLAPQLSPSAAFIKLKLWTLPTVPLSKVEKCYFSDHFRKKFTPY